MRRASRTPMIGWAFPILLLATCLLVPQAWGEEPILVLHLTDGGSTVYALSDITQIGFADEDTLVVVSGGGSDAYATEAIARITFSFEFSGVEDPREAAGLIEAIHLFQNWPNPLSSGTRIGFELPRAGEVELSVYSPDGRLVRTLLAEQREAGRHAITWDGSNEAGRRVPGGAYFYRLRAPGIEESRRMILLP